MKYVIPAFLFITSFAYTANAQFELKSNPIALIFAAPSLSAEYGFTEDFGVEAYGIIFPDGEGIAFVSAKYYLNPKEGLDRFNIGGFLAAGSLGIGAGFQLGQKVVAKKGLVFEFGIGLGRGFTDEPFLPYFKLDLGYRFKKKE